MSKINTVHKKPGTAIVAAKRSDCPAVIDVSSSPAEKLSSDERRELATHEKAIERGARAFLDLGNALEQIRDKRLYRATHSTFEAYLNDRWNLERSMGYRYIDAVRIHRKTSAIADRLKLRLTNESHFRAMLTPDLDDAPHIVELAAKKIQPNANGERIPTAKILAAAKREYTLDPAELKRRQRPQDKAARGNGHAKQAREETVFGDPTQWQKALASSPIDGSDPDYWNGQPCAWARQLRSLAAAIDRAIAWCRSHPGALQDLASLLSGRALELTLDSDSRKGAEPQRRKAK